MRLTLRLDCFATSRSAGVVVLRLGRAVSVHALRIRLVAAVLEELVRDLQEPGELSRGDKVVAPGVLQS